MTPTAPSLPAPRVLPNPRHAFGGILRLTSSRLLASGHWLAVGGLLAVLALIVIGFLSAGNGPKLFVGWSISFYFTFVVPLLAFISAAGAIRDDLKPGSVDYVFTRPVSRSAFVLFKYLSHVACVQVDFLLAFALLVGIAFYRHVPDLPAALPMLLLAQVLMIVAFSAFGMLCGVLTSRYVIIGIVYGIVVEVSIGQIPSQLSRLSMTRQIRTMLHPLVANAQSPFTDNTILADSSPLTVAGLCLAFAAASLALAAGAFTLQELAGAGPRET